MYKSKEYNGMDILDSIFSDQRQKDVMNIYLMIQKHMHNCSFQFRQEIRIQSYLCQWLATGYSNFRHKSSNWNIFESGVKHLTSNGHMMDQKFVYVVHNIKHLWVIMWHIFTSTNNTTTILFPTQLWELLYTYLVIKSVSTRIAYQNFQFN
jgi:hypothetical protein